NVGEEESVMAMARKDECRADRIAQRLDRSEPVFGLRTVAWGQEHSPAYLPTQSLASRAASRWSQAFVACRSRGSRRILRLAFPQVLDRAVHMALPLVLVHF